MTTSGPYVEDFYVDGSDRLTCHSPIDMVSVAATSASFSVVDFTNDPPSSHPSESMLPVSDLDRTLNFYFLFYLLTIYLPRVFKNDYP